MAIKIFVIKFSNGISFILLMKLCFLMQQAPQQAHFEPGKTLLQPLALKLSLILWILMLDGLLPKKGMALFFVACHAFLFTIMGTCDESEYL